MDTDPSSRRFRSWFLGALLCIAALVSAATPAPGVAEAKSALSRTMPWLGLAAVALAAGVLCALVQAALSTGLRERRGEEEGEVPIPRPFRVSYRENLGQWAVASLGTALFGTVAVLAMTRLGAAADLIHPSTVGFVAGAGTALVVLLLTETVARNIGVAKPRTILRVAGWPWLLLTWPLQPLAALAARGSLLHPARTDENSMTMDERELRLLPHVRGVDRLVEEGAVEMMDSVREFTESTAKDIMTPRTDVQAVPIGIPREELFQVLRESPYSRLVVYRRTIDDVAGVLLAKQTLLNRPEDPMAKIRQPILVPHDMRLPELLGRLRQGRLHMAIVVDEYGGTAGIVTLHDLFEQIVGTHIEDEPEEEEGLWIEQDGPDHARLSGRVELWEVNEELNLELDERVARTIGGYLMHRFGRLPEVGASWMVQGGVFRVSEIESNRITALEFVRDVDAVEVLEPVAEEKI